MKEIFVLYQIDFGFIILVKNDPKIEEIRHFG